MRYRQVLTLPAGSLITTKLHEDSTLRRKYLIIEANTKAALDRYLVALQQEVQEARLREP